VRHVGTETTLALERMTDATELPVQCIDKRQDLPWRATQDDRVAATGGTGDEQPRQDIERLKGAAHRPTDRDDEERDTQ
jgi:hypothetical protein